MRVTFTSTQPSGRRAAFAFFVDGNVIKTVDQSPDYPLQLMLSLYEFPASEYGESTTPYPKTFTVDYVRGYRLAD